MLPDDTDDTDVATDKVAKKISREIGDIETDRENCHTHINKDICSKFQSDTLRDLLSKLSKRLHNSLPGLMIGNMITAKPSHASANNLSCFTQGFKGTSEGFSRFWCNLFL